MQVHESGENYLETILILERRQGQVRSVDIAGELGFSKPSVSVAMKQFRENGLIAVDGDGFIHLTESGRDIAERIYERHCLLSRYLMLLGVSPEVAQADACKLEHDLSQESFDKIRQHYEKHRQDEA